MSTPIVDTIIKYFVCLIGFAVAAGGGWCLALGIMMKNGYSQSVDIMRQLVSGLEFLVTAAPWDHSANALIALGSILLVLGLLACCGTYWESKLLLSVFAALMTVIAILEIAIIIILSNYGAQTRAQLRDELTTALKKHYSADRNDTFTSVMNTMMAELKCCGINNSTDFAEAKKWMDSNPNEIPPACCKLKKPLEKLEPIDPDCLENPTEGNSYYQTGCYTLVQKSINNAEFHILLMCAILICCEVIAACTACYLRNTFK